MSHLDVILLLFTLKRWIAVGDCLVVVSSNFFHITLFLVLFKSHTDLLHVVHNLPLVYSFVTQFFYTFVPSFLYMNRLCLLGPIFVSYLHAVAFPLRIS